MRAGGENFRLYSTFNYIKEAHLLINNLSYTCTRFAFFIFGDLQVGWRTTVGAIYHICNGPAHYLIQLNAGCRQWSDADTNGLLD